MRDSHNSFAQPEDVLTADIRALHFNNLKKSWLTQSEFPAQPTILKILLNCTGRSLPGMLALFHP